MKKHGVAIFHDIIKIVTIFKFTLIIELRNFDLENHLNFLIFFDKKMMLDLNMPCQTVSNLVSATLIDPIF